MKKSIKDLQINDEAKSVILYLILGAMTTVINIFIFSLCTNLLHMDYRISNGIAWIFSVLFAYITNKKYVFKSKTISKQEKVRELFLFFGMRLATFAVDLLILMVLISGWHMQELWAKVIANIVVLLLNYFCSKVFVFKK